MAEESEKMKTMQDVNRDRNLRTPQMKQEMKNSVSLMVTQ